MSYILEALKKAESERKLGQVPGVHAPTIAEPYALPTAPFWHKPSSWAALAGVVVLGASAAWWLWSDGKREAPAVPAMASAPVAATGQSPAGQGMAAPAPGNPVQSQQPAPQAASRPSVSAPENSAPSASGSTASAAPREAEPAQAAKPPATAATKPASDKTAAAAKQAKEKRAEREAVRRAAASAAGSTTAAKAPAVSAQPSAKVTPSTPPQSAQLPPSSASQQAAQQAAQMQSVPTLRELPEAIQREIPPAVVGGYIYASNPAERSMLINNRLLREGDQIAAGLTLERMMPKEALFNFRGYRYRVSY